MMSFTCEAGYPQTDRECAWCGASREQSCRRPPPDPRLAEINKLRAELAEAKKPDCKTCELVRFTFFGEPMCARRFEPVVCINGDGYIAAEPVRLYEIDAAMAGGA